MSGSSLQSSDLTALMVYGFCGPDAGLGGLLGLVFGVPALGFAIFCVV